MQLQQFLRLLEAVKPLLLNSLHVPHNCNVCIRFHGNHLDGVQDAYIL